MVISHWFETVELKQFRKKIFRRKKTQRDVPVMKYWKGWQMEAGLYPSLTWFERNCRFISEKAMAPHSSTLATSCEELTHWKRLWCWEGLGAGGEGDDRGWDGWMASLTRWKWVWVNSRSWWWTGMPGVLQFMDSQRIRHDWATELNWTGLCIFTNFSRCSWMLPNSNNHCLT